MLSNRGFPAMWPRIVLPALILYLIWPDSRLSKMALPTFCGHWFQLSLFHSFGEGIRSLFLLAWHDVAVDIAGCAYAGVSQPIPCLSLEIEE